MFVCGWLQKCHEFLPLLINIYKCLYKFDFFLWFYVDVDTLITLCIYDDFLAVSFCVIFVRWKNICWIHMKFFSSTINQPTFAWEDDSWNQSEMMLVLLWLTDDKRNCIRRIFFFFFEKIECLFFFRSSHIFFFFCWLICL